MCSNTGFVVNNQGYTLVPRLEIHPQNPYQFDHFNIKLCCTGCCNDFILFDTDHPGNHLYKHFLSMEDPRRKFRKVVIHTD